MHDRAQACCVPMGHLDYQVVRMDLPGGRTGCVVTDSRAPTAQSQDPLPTPNQDDWRDFLSQLASDASSLSDVTVLKHSPTTQVFRVRWERSAPPLDIICKRYAATNVLRRWTRFVAPAAPRRHLQRAMWLLRAGIATPQPLAWIEPGFRRGDAWLVTPYIPDLVDLDRFVMQDLGKISPERQYECRRAVERAIVDLLVRLRETDLNHRDLKASNILLAGGTDDWDDVRAWLVDLDGLRRLRRWRPVAIWQPLIRLAASLQNDQTITRSDRARVVRALVRCGRMRSPSANSAWRSHVRALAPLAAEYNRRSRRRKSGKLDGFGGESG